MNHFKLDLGKIEIELDQINQVEQLERLKGRSNKIMLA